MAHRSSYIVLIEWSMGRKQMCGLCASKSYLKQILNIFEIQGTFTIRGDFLQSFFFFVNVPKPVFLEEIFFLISL